MIKLLDVEKEGLLTNFINCAYEKHVEPSREGVPKGDPIGYTKSKNGAVLLSMTSYSIKKQSEMLSVSYSLLRKWRSELEFKVKTNNIYGEFVEFYMNEFVKVINRILYDEQVPLLKNNIKTKEIDEIPNSIKEIIRPIFFSDAHLYNESLIYFLFMNLFTHKYDFNNSKEYIDWIKSILIYYRFKKHLHREDRISCFVSITNSYAINMKQVIKNDEEYNLALDILQDLSI